MRPYIQNIIEYICSLHTAFTYIVLQFQTLLPLSSKYMWRLAGRLQEKINEQWGDAGRSMTVNDGYLITGWRLALLYVEWWWQTFWAQWTRLALGLGGARHARVRVHRTCAQISNLGIYIYANHNLTFNLLLCATLVSCLFRVCTAFYY